MSYFNAVAGARPKFAPCDPNDSRQTSWTATAAGGTAPAGALVFCTSGGTLCSSANAQTGVVTLQTRNGNDPAQQWSSLPGGASGQFTNGAAGIGNCAQAGLKLVVKPCDPNSGLQQFYTYGPTTTARMATQDYFKHLLVSDWDESEIEGEEEEEEKGEEVNDEEEQVNAEEEATFREMIDPWLAESYY